MLYIHISLIFVFVLLSGFFATAEYAMLRMRPNRVQQMLEEGVKSAAALLKITDRQEAYLTACQLGLTISALGLGWIGERTVRQHLLPALQTLPVNGTLLTSVFVLMVFSILTLLHAALGELAPKTLAVQKPERVSLLTAKPLLLFCQLLAPVLWLLNFTVNLIVKLLGLKPAMRFEQAHSEEEIRNILSDSYESGEINKTELGYVSRIFAFDNLLAREIMVPRTDMVCLYMNKSLEENMEIIKREQYTRFPVAKENKDEIIGFINTKQFFLQYDYNPAFNFRSLLLPPMTVPDVMPVKILLKRMQAERVHIALLLDEYGGTSGLITIEDILEEIVGEIRDEFDSDERKAIEMIAPDHYLVEGKVLLSELEDELEIDLDNEEVDTIGGWIYSLQPDIKQGESILVDEVSYKVTEMDLHRIRKVEIVR